MEGTPYFEIDPKFHITYEGAMTIVMIILPVITSVLNFVVGCFTFDPLLFELNGLAKELTRIEYKILKLNNKKSIAKYEINHIEKNKNQQKELLEKHIACVAGKRPYLRTIIFK